MSRPNRSNAKKEVGSSVLDGFHYREQKNIVTYDKEFFRLKVINEFRGQEAYASIGPVGLLRIAKEMIRVAHEMMPCLEKK
ncbi:hypothetical protein ACM5Q9_09710 [Advenella sp. RU8]|uniref:hypothetical protein n=1 Tax=Advenella sp. RU8 TaxID=3399575 RepID=UPI003AAB19E8